MIYLSFIVGPVRIENNGILTHLQKYSHFGLMLTWPFCFHFWLFWKLQEQNYHNLNPWIPGTEQGIYFRTPGYRYDCDLGYKWTWGYIGGHWD